MNLEPISGRPKKRCRRGSVGGATQTIYESDSTKGYDLAMGEWLPVPSAPNQPPFMHQSPTPEFTEAAQQFQRRVLDDWGCPSHLCFESGVQPHATSLLGDALPNNTVWFANLDELVQQARALNWLAPNSDFLDIGAGVGLACVYAVERCGFASALGIELDPATVAMGRDLIDTLAVLGSTRDRLNLEQGDAATFRIPTRRGRASRPLMVFLFNPFGSKTAEAFIRRNELRSRQDVVIALANDHLLATFTGALPYDAYRCPTRNLSLLRHASANS